MSKIPKFQRPVILSGHSAAVYALAPWRDGVLSGGGDGLLAHWTTPFGSDGRVVAQLEDRIVVILPLADAQDAQILVGTLSGDLYWIDTAGDHPPRRWAFHRDGLFGLCQVGDFVFAVGGEGGLSRWSVTTGEFVDSVAVDHVRLRSIAYLAAEELLVVGTAAGDLHFIDPTTLSTVELRERAHESTIFSLAVGADTLYSAGRDGAIRAWRAARPFTQLAHVAAHGSTVNSLALRVDGWLASGGRDREARVWRTSAFAKASSSSAEPVFFEAATDELVLAKALNPYRDGGHVHSVNSCCWLGEILVTAGDDRTIRVWVPAISATHPI